MLCWPLISLLGLMYALVPFVCFHRRSWGLAVRHGTSTRCSSSKFFLLMWVLCFLRIGEARNPGPGSAQQFVLGYCNPSG